MYVRVCAKMSVSNKAAGGVCWGASLCLPTPPPPYPVGVTECAAMMCPLAKPSASLFSLSLSVSPSRALCFFVYVTQCTFISTSLIILLSHCRYCHSSTVWMSDCPLGDPSALSPSSSPSVSLMVNCAGSCVADSVSVNYCTVSLFET